MAYLDDFNMEDYVFYSNLSVDERDFTITLAHLVGISYKILPGVDADGNLKCDEYSMWCKANQKEEAYALMGLCSYFEPWRSKYLMSVGVPKDLLFKPERYGPIGTEKEHFPEYADKIQEPLPFNWEEVLNEIDKFKEEYRQKHPEEYGNLPNKKENDEEEILDI